MINEQYKNVQIFKMYSKVSARLDGDLVLRQVQY